MEKPTKGQTDIKVYGQSGSQLKIIGMIFILAGVISRFCQAIIMQRVAGDYQTILDVLDLPNMMIIATTALFLEAVATCAVPIFAFLVVEGFKHSQNYIHYLLRLTVLAIVSEIPFNLAMQGQIVAFSNRNPVFAMVFALILLYFYRYFGGRSVKNVVIKVFLTIIALSWVFILKVYLGPAFILMVAVFASLQNQTVWKGFGGALATGLCSIFSPYFLASPMGVLVIHFYNGQKGRGRKLWHYLSYPLLLLISGLVLQIVLKFY